MIALAISLAQWLLISISMSVRQVNSFIPPKVGAGDGIFGGSGLQPPPSTILRKLGTASRKNKLYFAFRELGRVVRTVFLLEYISNDELRRIIQAAQNKCEGFNKFAQWAYFGSDNIEENVRENQLKIIKYNHLIANLLIFHNCHTMTQALKELEAEGMQLTPELLAAFSPYRTHHTNRFGMYELRERELGPIDYSVTFQME